MRSQIGSPSDHQFTQPLRLQQFLIPPYDRLKFAIQFVFATGVGWLLVNVLLSPLQNSILPNSWQPAGMLGTFVSGLVFGLIVGATQWLALRRYVPDALWILASTVGYVILLTTFQGWFNLIAQGVSNGLIPSGLSAIPNPLTTLLFGVIGAILGALCAIWLGLAQWLVLRQYAEPSWGWVFVPSIAILLSFVLLASQWLLSAIKVILPLNISVLGAGVLGMTQAIALSMLLRRHKEMVFSQNSLLAIAPEIMDYGQVQLLGERLERQLNHAWNQEMAEDHPLTYLIGVNQMGAIVAYEPMNQFTAENTNLTPLPDLVSPVSSIGSESLPPLAKFQVIFLPSGSLELISWRGLPLFWIGFGLMLAVVLLSAIVGFISTKLPAIG